MRLVVKLALALSGIVLLGTNTAHAQATGTPPPVPPSAPGSPPGQGPTSSVCQFTAGPKSGGWQDYAPIPGAPVGTPCQDSMGSTGRVVVSGTGEKYSTMPATSTICQYTNGPKAGGWQDYAPLPAIPIGTPCGDGAGSTGKAIATGTGQKYDTAAGRGAQGMSTICQFTNGPKAGGWHNYAPMTALPIGAPCRDGMGSTGTVVAGGTGPQQ